VSRFVGLLAATTLLLHGPLAATQNQAWQPPAWQVQLPLWPGRVPHAVATQVPEDTTLLTTHPVAGKPWVFIEKVARPTLAVYPPKQRNTGAAVVVFPGGGYHILAIDLEGTEVCEWLTSRGVACIVLKYRVPGVGKGPKSGAYPQSLAALDDAQRALGLVRFHAAEWGIDPHKIGVLGFSAGGHLAAAISTNFVRRSYRAVDSADAVSCRPDFAVVIYPGHLLEHTSRPFQLNPYVPVTQATPPTFIVQAEDDPVDDVENSVVYYAALKRAGVPVEMHLFPHGGHAFGLRPTTLPITHWPTLVETWLVGLGVLPAEARQ
jgi:acetyl esterase/lipase